MAMSGETLKQYAQASLRSLSEAVHGVGEKGAVLGQTAKVAVIARTTRDLHLLLQFHREEIKAVDSDLFFMVREARDTNLYQAKSWYTQLEADTAGQEHVDW